MSTDILRRISADKALGPDGIPDKWIRKKRNGDELMEFINEWMNGTRPSPQDQNEANLFLLSKEDTPFPLIDRIRPLAAYSPIRKCMETALDLYDSEYHWAMIKKNQYGFRPGS